MDGVIIINKPAGMTSHDVVFKLRKILKTKKIGHSGTLDPDATGVLVVLVGKACKVLPFLEDTDKTYVAEIKLGERTLSDDIFDEVLETKEVTPIIDFQAELDKFKGEITQLPPYISSVKVNGKKLYEYARKGEFIERPLRNVEIYDIKSLDDKKLKFMVSCSSGTYIRSLCVDIAANTNNLGCMKSLVRTQVGRFSIDDAQTLEEIEKGNVIIHSTFNLLSHIKYVEYDNIDEVYQGKKIKLDCEEDRVAIISNNEVIAIYDRLDKDKNVFKSIRGLW